ncbi:MAG: TolC family protein [Candidatus Korobacteraceae bacterium]
MRGTPCCFPLSVRTFLFLILCVSQALSEPVPFRRAIELALARAEVSSPAVADQQRARAAVQEARSAYLPHLTVGSGLGATYGYPLSIEGSAPSIFNVNYQSTLYNASQKALTQAARETLRAQDWTIEDARRNAALEAATTYVHLHNLESSRRALQQQSQESSQLIGVMEARVREGVEAQIELTRARLLDARTRMALVDAEGGLRVLRSRLAQLTGLAPAAIEIVPASIPALPQPETQQDVVAQALAASAEVRAAEQQARAQELRAEAARKARYPSVDLAAQYGLFSRINNYDEFFQRFQSNNATIGLAIRFPFLDYTQKAFAEVADAEALRARQQLDQVREQVATETLQLTQTENQLAIAAEVADLDRQLAQSNVDATQQRIESEAPPASGMRPVSPRDLQMARIEAEQRIVAALDAGFQLQRARLQLLNAIGKLREWALGN